MGIRSFKGHENIWCHGGSDWQPKHHLQLFNLQEEVKHRSKVGNESAPGAATTGNDPAPWCHRWAEVKDVELAKNSEQHAEKL